MSFREKGTWAVVMIVATSFGAYLATVVGGPAPDGAGPWQPLALGVVSLIVLLVTAHAVLAARMPGGSARDDVDRQINHEVRPRVPTTQPGDTGELL